jgi:hypothetical protein
MDPTRDALLQPSLIGAGPQASMYAARAGFYTAFFGGPFAAVAFSALNSRRAARSATDAPWQLLAFCTSVAVIWALFKPSAWSYRIDHVLGHNAGTLIARVWSLLLFGGECLLHKKFYRHMEMLGVKPPRALAPCLACVAFGLLATFGLVWSLGL